MKIKKNRYSQKNAIVYRQKRKPIIVGLSLLCLGAIAVVPNVFLVSCKNNSGVDKEFSGPQDVFVYPNVSNLACTNLVKKVTLSNKENKRDWYDPNTQILYCSPETICDTINRSASLYLDSNHDDFISVEDPGQIVQFEFATTQITQWYSDEIHLNGNFVFSIADVNNPDLITNYRNAPSFDHQLVLIVAERKVYNFPTNASEVEIERTEKVPESPPVHFGSFGGTSVPDGTSVTFNQYFDIHVTDDLYKEVNKYTERTEYGGVFYRNTYAYDPKKKMVYASLCPLKLYLYIVQYCSVKGGDSLPNLTGDYSSDSPFKDYELIGQWRNFSSSNRYFEPQPGTDITLKFTLEAKGDDRVFVLKDVFRNFGNTFKFVY